MKKVAVVFLTLFVLSNICAAEEEEYTELAPIVVSLSRFETGTQGATGTFSVISNEEIEETVGDSVLDVLRKEEGININEYYGTGLKGFVDLRGFGETAPMNTLVLIDGRRANSVDISGVDWFQIPKESVERIEILRGGGSVLYGDNAAGGVINIITKKAKEPFSVKFEQIQGSYGYLSTNLQTELFQKGCRLFINAKKHNTTGYRQNSFIDGIDLTGSLGYEITDIFRVDIDAHHNEVEFGLPGALYESDLDGDVHCRIDSKYPNNRVDQEDRHFRVQPELKLTDDITITTGFGFREREYDTDFTSSAADTGRVTIKTYNITPRVMFEFEKKHKIITGFDFYKHDNESDSYSVTGGKLTSAADTDKKTRAYYVQLESNPVKDLFLSSGYRYEEATYDFNYNDFNGWYTNVDETRKLKANAINAGVSCNFFGENKIYVNFNKSFRLPATDEFLIYDWSTFPTGRNTNIGIGAQKGFDYDIGVNLAYQDKADLDFNVFWMDIEKEIYLDPYTYVNQNYNEDTRRTGVETQLNISLIENLEAYANYTYTKAKFRGGDFSGNEIPGVPEHFFGVGIDASVGIFSFNVDFRGTGKKRFVSDQRNLNGYVGSYVVTDIGCNFEYKGVEIFGQVNNIFNKEYSEYGARSIMYDVKGYYPSPELNYVVGASYRF